MLVRKRSSHLQTFVREQPQKTGALFHATLNFGGAGWRLLMLALPIVRSLFTCKLLSVTCPKWTRESVRPLSLSGSLWVSLGLCGPLWSSFGFSGPPWASLGLSGLLSASVKNSGSPWGLSEPIGASLGQSGLLWAPCTAPVHDIALIDTRALPSGPLNFRCGLISSSSKLQADGVLR